MNHSKPYTRSDELHMARYASVVQGSRKKPISGTTQLSNARESTSLNTQMTNSASRGEISASSATRQGMGGRYRFGPPGVESRSRARAAWADAASRDLTSDSVV